MDLRHLQTFVAAAECENFTRAAEVLNITQAAVSKQIAALEADLGVTLFDRVGRSVVPSEHCRRLYDYARRILELVEEARRELGHESGRIHGALRIAASTVPAEWLLPELLVAFREVQPDVHVSVDVSDSAQATASVEAGEADVGIVGEAPQSSRLSARPIAVDELVLVASPSHPLARRRKLTLQQLRSEPLIVRESGSASRRCVDQAIEAAGLAPSDLNIALEMNSNAGMRTAVEQGLGVAFQSRSVVARELAAGKLVRLPVEGVRAQRHLYAVTDSTRMLTAATRAFLALLAQPRGRESFSDRPA
jgi:DNA-binding transcriptional LysR family regulator